MNVFKDNISKFFIIAYLNLLLGKLFVCDCDTEDALQLHFLNCSETISKNDDDTYVDVNNETDCRQFSNYKCYFIFALWCFLILFIVFLIFFLCCWCLKKMEKVWLKCHCEGWLGYCYCCGRDGCSTGSCEEGSKLSLSKLKTETSGSKSSISQERLESFQKLMEPDSFEDYKQRKEYKQEYSKQKK